MILLYIGGGLVLLLLKVDQLPAVFTSIFRSAFSPHEATGAFIGGTAGYAFLFGMKRALYSNEAGQGSSPIVHSAARTREPVREGIVAGLEPFIDTLIVCTFSALVILVSGVWNRAPDAQFLSAPRVEAAADGRWTLADTPAPALADGVIASGQRVYVVVHADPNHRTDNDLHRLHGTARRNAAAGPPRSSGTAWRAAGAPSSRRTGSGSTTSAPRSLQGIRHGLGRLRQVAGHHRLLAVRLLHHDFLDLLRRAGRHLPVRRALRDGRSGS